MQLIFLMFYFIYLFLNYNLGYKHTVYATLLMVWKKQFNSCKISFPYPQNKLMYLFT